MTRFSIIIPHHNIPVLLQRCLDSIPERDDIQVIVVDDNSADAENRLKQCPGIYKHNVSVHFTKEGRGAGYARNEGLKHATGKWVLFADADDFFIDKLPELLDEHYDNDADIIYFNVKSVMSDDTTKEAFRTKNELFLRYEKTGDEALFRCMYSEPWGKMIKRELIETNNIRFDETKIDNDHFFSVVSGCLAKSICVVNTPIYVVTVRENSLSFKFADSLEKLLTRLDVETRVQIFEREHGYDIKPMPIRGLMMLLLKRNPVLFLRRLAVIKRHGISVTELLAQMLSLYMKKYDHRKT